MAARVLVGTASWTDKSLIDTGRFYPPAAKTADSRLQYYSAQFPIVEVDSSYYGLPSERNARLWVERTPGDFTFDVKAFSALTQHPTAMRALPKDLRSLLPAEAQQKRSIYYKDMPEEVRGALWQRFAAALLPLDSAGKLGVVLFQFPPWFLPGPDSRAFLAELNDRLPQYTPAIEFRSPDWFEAGEVDRTLGLLSDLRLPFVCVDEPQGTRASVPPIVAVTAAIAVVRFHGRNNQAWARRGVPVAEKYDYLYSPEELQSWAPPIQRLAEEAGEVHAIMNNCHDDKAVRNARELAAILGVSRPQADVLPAAQARLL